MFPLFFGPSEMSSGPENMAVFLHRIGVWLSSVTGMRQKVQFVHLKKELICFLLPIHTDGMREKQEAVFGNGSSVR